MTLQVGDKVVAIPLRDGGWVTVRSGALSVGDKAVLIPGANGQIYAVRPASPQVGNKVILYPLRNGGHVCLASADADDGGSSPSVMPPGNFDALRTGPGTADLDWLPGEGNTAVRIVRRSDRYPVHINDGTVAYEGGGDEVEDTGLDYRLPYYYCAWGKAGSSYSNGYQMDVVGTWGTSSDPILICDAWRRLVETSGESEEFGPFTYYWDGQGQVYVSASATAVQSVWVDSYLSIQSTAGTINSGDLWVHHAPVEITSILRPGRNTVTATITDEILSALGDEIGARTPLYIMRTL